ncbi:peptide/nickel transport system ATP-binding protein/oligopeptide transport system ATP-binding protein [Bacillus oleivorans]|uniref:Peptide/nickel transport system ATP-binding protein/oligopeptide transport system ATP-binding protein n=1 Tax=Bacillus oleivorans TaxID=1448271 RepID=A0A285D6B0_9BACI|nr:oligopeptide/dipeptide ABC transporter ATP-binding protein [Bacillus oleivorans]SNX74693.1 peptide/nickel transport system ATP-binding protein/oligopeptide transport system ATP-binding protein [Bacillus oleivorans]
MTVPLLEVNILHKHYKHGKSGLFDKATFVKAVNGVTFSLYPGETFGLVGESGCGKSTTGQVILQLIKQTSGTIKYKGEDISSFSSSKLKEWRKAVQIVFQDPYSSLNPKKTIGWILNEPLVIHKIGNKASREKKILQILEDVGLDASFLNRYPHELSGGQRQRVAIASAIILNPEFIVIDEGVSALDVSVQAQILNLLKKLQKQYKLTYLFISHDLNVVRYFCDRIAVMYLGEIVEIGKAEDFGVKPLHPYADALFSAIPTLDEEHHRIVLKGDLPNPSNPPSGCPFHTRCPYVLDICKTVKPETKSLREEHLVSCHKVVLEEQAQERVKTSAVLNEA